MDNTRGMKILMMIRSQDQNRLENLDSWPKHESTKGTMERERKIVLKDWNKVASEMLHLFEKPPAHETQDNTNVDTSILKVLPLHSNYFFEPHFGYQIDNSISQLHETPMMTDASNNVTAPISHNTNQEIILLDISHNTNCNIKSSSPVPIDTTVYIKGNLNDSSSNGDTQNTNNISSIEDCGISTKPERRINVDQTRSHAMDMEVLTPNIDETVDSNSATTSQTDPGSPPSQGWIFNDESDSEYRNTDEESSSDSACQVDDKSIGKMHQTNKGQLDMIPMGNFTKGDTNNIHSMFKEKHESVNLPVPSKKGKTRVYDKKQACLYCRKLFSKLPQHIEVAHSNMKEVAEIRSLPRKSKERADKIRKLRNRGNFLHNNKVLTERIGTLIVNRRSKKEGLDYGQYLPCEYCYAFFQKRKMWHHVRQCHDKGKDKSCNKRSVITNSRLLTPVDSEASALFQNNILKHMRDGAEKNVIKSDVTLCILGSKEALRNKRLPQQKNHIAYKIRLLAKLIIHFKESGIPLTKLAHCVLAENFETVAKTVVKLTLDENKPSVGTKLGHHLKKCAKIVRNRCIIEGDEDTRKKVEDFLLLYEDEWEDRVSKPAKDALDRRRYVKKTDLPSTDDIMSLNSYIKNKEQNFIDNNFENASYTEVAKIALTHLIIFNRRRPGEVSLLEIQSYIQRIKATEPQGEINEMLSQSEKKCSLSWILFI